MTARKKKTQKIPGLAPTPPTISEETREKMTSLITQLIALASDLTFEIATTDCPKANDCPIVQKGKELAKVIKALREEFSAKRVK